MGLVERIAAKCKGWQARLLSQGGKGVLVKNVLQAMPAHIFYAINPPKAVIKQIQRLFAQFFWGKEDGRQKHHWSSWETLARPITEGGVGFVGLNEMIEAAGAKLWWHFR